MADNRRILVVEDDPDGQALVAHILQYMQLPIDVAGDVDTALATLGDGRAHRALIVDLALPGRSGWELLSEVRAKATTAALPCVAVTAYHTSKVKDEALRAGFDAYFAKPLDATHFARSLQAVLEG